MPLVASELGFAFPRSGPVISALSAEFRPSGISAIVGPNGAGKTTLLRLLLGLLSPDAGSVRLGDRDVRSIPHADRARSLAFAAQRPSLAFGYTAVATVAFGIRSADRRERRRRAMAALADVALESRAEVRMDRLSAGQQQRVSLARALAQLESAHQPRYLLADEPTATLDPGSTLALSSLLRGRSRAGLGVVLVLHDLQVAARLADTVLLLACDGTVAASGPPASVLTPEHLAETYGTQFDLIEHDGCMLPVPRPEPAAGTGGAGISRAGDRAHVHSSS
ncbi:MAG: ABC transporter ATP-binding protein [Planctomycetota bacterium]